MSGLYQCPKCGNYYTLPDEFEESLSRGVESEGIFFGIVVCECNSCYGVGGESYYDDEESGIMMFGFDPISVKEEYPTFNAVMLEEVNEENTGFSTWNNGRTIHLKPRKRD